MTRGKVEAAMGPRSGDLLRTIANALPATDPVGALVAAAHAADVERERMIQALAVAHGLSVEQERTHWTPVQAICGHGGAQVVPERATDSDRATSGADAADSRPPSHDTNDTEAAR